MKIHFVKIKHFRRLNEVKVSFSDEVTIFVGANNSGKTSTIEALSKFLTRKPFTYYDFLVNTRKIIREIGKKWEKADANLIPDLKEWLTAVPTLDIWLSVCKTDFHSIKDFIPTLNWDGKTIGFRLVFQPKDVNKLFEAYRAEQAKFAADLLKKSFEEFLTENLWKYFEIQTYLLPEEESETILELKTLASNPLQNLIKVDVIAAQRGFYDADANLRGVENKLSDQLIRFYERHVNPENLDAPKVTEADEELLKSAIKAQKAFDEKIKSQLADSLKNLQRLGYPSEHNPAISLKSKIDMAAMLNHDTAIQYELLCNSSESRELLPESYNGLGYQNLISLLFNLLSFRENWLNPKSDSEAGKIIRPIHLVLIEEPEAHLHVQVQRIFVKRALEILNDSPLLDDKQLTTQLVISTHSSDIAQEQDFSNLRYFKRIAASVDMPTTKVETISKLDGNVTRFAKRYLGAIHYDIFFADAVIMVEGAAEQILLPSMLESRPKLRSKYISIVPVGGSHAKVFSDLLKLIGLPTLILTDLDPFLSEDQNSKKKSKSEQRKENPPQRNKGFICTNPTIKFWFKRDEPLSMEEVLDMPATKKEEGDIRIAYQFPVFINEAEFIATTFEDSLIYSNWEPFLSYEFEKESSELKSVINKLKKAGANEQNPIYASFVLPNLKKTIFALDLLSRYEELNIRIPNYIDEGFQWLETKLYPDVELN